MKWRSRLRMERKGFPRFYRWLDNKMYWLAFGSEHPMRFMR